MFRIRVAALRCDSALDTLDKVITPKVRITRAGQECGKSVKLRQATRCSLLALGPL